MLDNVGAIPSAVTFKAAEAAMWQLVQRYTGRVGYRATVKAEGLAADPPVIDCSGWFGVLITAAMNAENEAAGRTVFAAEDVVAMQAWADRIIMEIETRTGFILAGPAVWAGQPSALRNVWPQAGRRNGPRRPPATARHHACGAGRPSPAR